MPRQVDYYFSLQSPWAYVGHSPFQDVAKTYDLRVNYKPVVLVDLFSETGGLPLLKRHPVRQRAAWPKMKDGGASIRCAHVPAAELQPKPGVTEGK